MYSIPCPFQPKAALTVSANTELYTFAIDSLPRNRFIHTVTMRCHSDRVQDTCHVLAIRKNKGMNN